MAQPVIASSKMHNCTEVLKENHNLVSLICDLYSVQFQVKEADRDVTTTTRQLFFESGFVVRLVFVLIDDDERKNQIAIWHQRYRSHCVMCDHYFGFFFFFFLWTKHGTEVAHKAHTRKLYFMIRDRRRWRHNFQTKTYFHLSHCRTIQSNFDCPCNYSTVHF